MTIEEVYNNFDNECNMAEKAITEVIKLANPVSDDLLLVREFTIKQAFLTAFTGWEHFLENSMIAYSLDEPNLNGFKPQRYIFPIDEEHADRLIKGSAIYPDWSDINNVKEIAKRIFGDLNPYMDALNIFNSIYHGMKKTRNVIVHNSLKSKKEFDTLVRNEMGPSYVGLSASDFLLSQKGKKPVFYKYYIEHLRNAVNSICKYSI